VRIGQIRPDVVKALAQTAAVRSQGRRVAAAIRDEARRRAPKRTGALRKSIKVTAHRGSDTGGIPYHTVDAIWYAGFVEFGTINAAAKPFLRPAADAYARGDIQAKPPRKRG
jgi:HK97 gp10 family phage protein